MPEDEAIAVAAQVIEEEHAAEAPRQVKLSSGLVLRVRPVPPFLVQRAVAGFSRPKPPRWMNPDKEREEDNPNDPDYLAALANFDALTTEAAANVLLGAGTEIISRPKDLAAPEDDDWLEVLELADVDVPTTPRKRYLYWLKYYALNSVADLQAATNAVAAATGVSEEEVARVSDSFRTGTARGATNGLPAEAGGNRDNV